VHVSQKREGVKISQGSNLLYEPLLIADLVFFVRISRRIRTSVFMTEVLAKSIAENPSSKDGGFSLLGLKFF